MHVLNHIYKSLLHGNDKARWTKSANNEFGRLTRGNQHGVPYTDTMDFIPRTAIPEGRDITYESFRSEYGPLKDEPYYTRIVVAGDKVTYFEDPGSPVASLLETKLLLNSVISDAHLGSRFLSCDLKDFPLLSHDSPRIYAHTTAPYTG